MSIIVCTRHRADVLGDALADLRAQARPGDDLCVISQSDDPRVDAEIAHRNGFRCVSMGPAGLPAGRNRGLRESRAAWVLFFDDDVRLHPGCVDALAAGLAGDDVGAVVARIEEELPINAPAGTNRVDATGRTRVNLRLDRDAWVHAVKGAAFGVRRAAVAQVGGFDETLAATFFLEEADWSARAARAGWRIRACAAAGVVHRLAPRGGCRADARRVEQVRFAHTARYVRRHRSRCQVPAVMLVFGAIALSRALRWREPGAFTRLGAAFLAGLRAG